GLSSRIEVAVERERSHVLAPCQYGKKVMGVKARRGRRDLAALGDGKPHIGDIFMIVTRRTCGS
ncbi:hypothetical protein AAHH78_35675, partial [Burkholderia pseudomallei]